MTQPLTDWQLLTALQMRDDGATYALIAATLGRSPTTWWTRLKAIKDAEE